MDASLLAAAMKQYFTENGSTETAPSILWKAHKATMRGRLIELGARRKKEQSQQLNDLLLQIDTLDIQHTLSQHKSHLEALLQKREELKALLDSQTKSFKFSPKDYMNGVKKPGKQLAHSI